MARVICPLCRKAGNVPDEYLGQRIKCPSCNQRFSAPTLPPPPVKGKATPKPASKLTQLEEEIIAAVSAPPSRAEIELAAPPVATDLERVEPVEAPPPAVASATAPAGLSARATKACLYCGEEILAAALKCKHCGEFIDPAMRAAEEAKEIAKLAHTRGGQGVQQVVSINTAAPARPIMVEKKDPWRLLKTSLIFMGVAVLMAPLIPVVAGLLFLVGLPLFLVGLIVGAFG
jgi:hypothetical protein